jgi:hypothetical protein
MRKPLRIHKTWLIALAITIIALGTLISVLVFATGDSRLTVTGYSDVIRFQAEGVATLQVRIFDLSGKEVWDSGIVSGSTVDWNRNNDFGERLAYGAYIYSAQGWNAEGDLIFQKNGKLALMPGDKVQLQAAPAASSTSIPATEEEPLYAPMAYNATDFFISGTLGVGTDVPVTKCDIRGNIYVGDGSGIDSFVVGGRALSQSRMNTFYIHTSEIMGLSHQLTTGSGRVEVGQFRFSGVGENAGFMSFFTKSAADAGKVERMRITQDGKVGIGTSNTTAKLTVQDSSGQDLIAAYNSSNRVFVVKNNGEVRADGAYYSGAGDCNTGGFNAGGADVAERINTSEWMEAGYVVEIDPDHPGFFRKSSSPYTRRVAGIISTSPGVILGNSFDEATDDWEDNRPVLAVAGRVPCKVSTENGSIQIGDLLVASSTPGIAMKGNPERAIGAVVGKAMEPLEDGTGTIVVQVMLR